MKEYNNIKKEILLIEKQLNDLKSNKVVSDSVRGTSKYFPYIEKNYKIKGIDPKINSKLIKLNSKLLDRQDKLLNTRLEIEKFIDNISDSRIRTILEYKYIENLSWGQIALQLEYGNEDSIRKEHDRFFNKLEKE